MYTGKNFQHTKKFEWYYQNMNQWRNSVFKTRILNPNRHFLIWIKSLINLFLSSFNYIVTPKYYNFNYIVKTKRKMWKTWIRAFLCSQKLFNLWAFFHTYYKILLSQSLVMKNYTMYKWPVTYESKCNFLRW